MEIILSTFNQLAFLFLMIGVGYLLVQTRVLDQTTAGILSKLEITVLIPALILKTFIQQFRIETLKVAWQPLLGGVVLLAVLIPPSLVLVRFCAKGNELRNIYLYGLCFSNFSFMGNALISALYPEYFFEYLIFCLPLWIAIFAWATPFLLMPTVERRSGRDWIRVFLNPLCISIPVGMVLGLLEAPLPSFAQLALDATASSMSPVAMLLTGICVGAVDFKKTLRDGGFYFFSLFRLLIFPLVGLAVLAVAPLPVSVEVAVLMVLALPPGLNAIIIPSACGKDIKDASGMTILSHIFACVTIPMMLYLYERI